MTIYFPLARECTKFLIYGGETITHTNNEDLSPFHVWIEKRWNRMPHFFHEPSLVLREPIYIAHWGFAYINPY